MNLRSLNFRQSFHFPRKPAEQVFECDATNILQALVHHNPLSDVLHKILNDRGRNFQVEDVCTSYVSNFYVPPVLENHMDM